jgi:hypothetical protein
MENIEKLPLVLCLTVLGVVAINAGIIIWARRSQPSGEIQAFRRLANAARNPLSRQSAEFDELSRLVAKYKETSDSSSSQDENNE